MTALLDPQKVTISKKGLEALYIQRRHSNPGYWFNNAIAGPSTRLLSEGLIIDECVYFITSDLSYGHSARVYSIRYMNADGFTRTLGGGSIKYYTVSTAKMALGKIMTVTVTRNNQATTKEQ